MDCGQLWFVAQEERLNDVYIIRRSSESEAKAAACGVWPTEVSMYESILRIGKERGHAARYSNPSEALPICIDLVGQNPDIAVEAVASLINVELSDANLLVVAARTEIAIHGYPYPWTAA